MQFQTEQEELNQPAITGDTQEPYRSPLLDVPILDDFMTEVTASGLDNYEKLEAVDFWTKRAREAQYKEFNRPEQWQNNLGYDEVARNMAKTQKESIFQDESKKIIESTFKDRPENYNRFAKQMEKGGLNPASYTPEFFPVVQRLKDLRGKARIPEGSTGKAGEITTSNNRSIGDYSLNYDSSGEFDSAVVKFKKFGIKGEDQGLWTADVIHFPKDFDPVEHMKQQALKRRNDLLEVMSSLSDPSGSEYESQNNSLDSVTEQLMEAESLLEKFDSGDEVFLKQAKLDGVNAYVNDYVGDKIKTGDSKYKGVGMEVGESLKASLTWNNIDRFLINLDQGRINLGLAITEMVEGRYKPEDMQNEAARREKEILTGTKEGLESELNRLTAKGQEVDARATFSRLGTYNPNLAEIYEKTANTVGQGARIAAVFAAGPVAGYSSTFLEVQGAKIAELKAREAELREKGDVASADYLRDHSRGLSMRAALWEMVPEMMFPGHAAFRPVTAKEAILGSSRQFVKDVGGEFVEGGVTSVLGATDERVTGVINDQQYIERLKQSPEDAFFEGVGTIIPSGARAVIQGMTRGSAAKLAARTEASDKAAADRKAREEAFRADLQAREALIGTKGADEGYQMSVTETPAPEGPQASVTEPTPTAGRTKEGIAQTVAKGADDLLSGAVTVKGITEAEKTELQGSLEAQAKIAEAIVNESESVGDTPSADIVVDQALVVPPRTETEKRETRAYLEALKASAEKRFKEYGLSGASIAGNFVRNSGDGLPEGANFIITYPEGDKPMFPEGDENRRIQNKIENGQAKDVQEAIDQLVSEKWSIFSNEPFGDQPAMLHVANNNIAVGDARGQTILMSQNDLIKAIEDGTIDPSKNYFWFEQNQMLEGRNYETYNKLVESIPEQNWAMPKPSAITATDTQGQPAQSKANDQFHLRGTGFELDTVTIGGKTVGVKTNEDGSVTEEAFTGMDDMIESLGLTIEERDGFVTVPDPSDYSRDAYKITRMKGRFIARKDHPKLIAALNERFGENNWILKPDNQARRAGIIRGWNKDEFTANGQLSSDIPVEPDYFYVAQEKASGITMSARVDAKVTPEGDMVMIPNGIKMHYFTADQFKEDGTVNDEVSGSGWRIHGNEVIPLKFRNSLVGFFNSLKGTAYTQVPGSVYGFDLVLTKNGIKVMESNVATEGQYSGGLTGYGKTFSGLAATTKGVISPETIAAASAYFKLTGQNEIANYVMELAVERLGATPDQVPQLKQLYDKGILFSPTKSLREIGKGERVFISGLNLPKINSRKYHDVSKIDAPTISDILTSVEQSSSPHIADYTKMLARALRMQAEKTGSRGLSMKAFKSSMNMYYTPTIYGTGGYITVTGNAIEELMHESIHALTDAKFPQLLSVYNLPGITGNQYKQVLVNYMNDPAGNPLLKEVINDYLNAIQALGLSKRIFNDRPMKTGAAFIKNPPGYDYGFSSLDEFITNALTNPVFVRRLASIPDTSIRAYFRKLFDSLMQWLKMEHLPSNAKANNAWNKTFHDIITFVASDDIPGNTTEYAATVVAGEPHYNDLFTDRLTIPYEKAAAERFVWDRLQWRSAPEFTKAVADSFAKKQAKVFNLTLDKNGKVNAPSFFAKLKGANIHPIERDTINDLAIKYTDDKGKIDIISVTEELNETKGVSIQSISVFTNRQPTENARKFKELKHELETQGFSVEEEADGFVNQVYIRLMRQGRMIRIYNDGTVEDRSNKTPDPNIFPKSILDKARAVISSMTKEDWESGSDESDSAAEYGVNPYIMDALRGKVQISPGETITWAGDISLNIEKTKRTELRGFHHDPKIAKNQHSFVRGSLHSFAPGSVMHDGKQATGYEKIFQIWEVQSDAMNRLSSNLELVDKWIEAYQTGIDPYAEEGRVLNVPDETPESVRASSIARIEGTMAMLSQEARDSGDLISDKKLRDAISAFYSTSGITFAKPKSEIDHDVFQDARKAIVDYINKVRELSSWKTVALKAAVIHAQRLGATHISMLSGESVFRMEGHAEITNTKDRAKKLKGMEQNYDGDYIEVLKKLTGKTPIKGSQKAENVPYGKSFYPTYSDSFSYKMEKSVDSRIFPLDHIYAQPRLSENQPDSRPPVIFRSGYPEDNTALPYGNKKIQKGFDGKPMFDNYDINIPGTYWHETTINMPAGSTHEEIIKAINKKYKDAGQEPPVRMSEMKKSLPKKVRIGDFKINTKFLNAEDQTNLQLLRDRLAAGEKIPSIMLEDQLRAFQNKAERGEFAVLEQAYPEAFSSKNKEWTGFTNLAAAENTLADWLFANPGKLSEGDLFGDSTARRKKRKKLVKSFSAWVDTMIDMMKANELKTFFSHPPEVQALVDKALDFVLANYDASALSDRQVTALNLAMKTFLESDGYNIRGFAQLISQINTSEKLAKLEEVRQKLLADGVENPWGDPISDFRRAFVGDSKTGSSLADFALEATAIYNRPETRRAWSDMFAGYKIGLDAYKVSYNNMSELYQKRIDKEGSTTKLNDFRIGIALAVTQYEQNADPTPQLLRNVTEIQESIRRKLNSSNPNFRDEGAIEKVASDMLITPYIPALQAGMKYDQFIAAVEGGLTNQEYNLMRIARDPGVLFYSQLDAINQIARGKPIQNWKNYAKRVQTQLNKDNPTEHWGEKAIQNPDSILQPRKGLGKDAVFNFNWRGNFDYQLDETAYELSTGVERVMLFDTMRSPGFEGIMDGSDTSKARTRRMREQVGGVHSNIKNREIRYGTLIGGALQIAQASIAMKLATVRAPFNQLIPMLTYGLNNTKTLGLTLYNRLIPENKAKSDAFLKKHNRDLVIRMKQWDTFINRFRLNDKQKKSGIKTGAASVTESLGVLGQRMARAMTVGVTEAVYLPITLTNSVPEVFAARTVFFALYAQQLMDRKLIREVDDLYIGKEIPFDKESMAQAELEFDSFVMSPASPEFRAEASQRNSNAKVISQIFFQGLLRTATQQSLKAVTAGRDLWHATNEYLTKPSPSSKAFLKSSAIEVEKQMLNIGLYYGIGYAIHNTLGNMMASTFFAVAANISDDDEERDKWMRRMRALEKINKESQLQFQIQQAAVDTLFAVTPMPAILHSNPGREVFNIAMSGFFLGKDTPDGYQQQLDQLREQRDQIQRIIDKQLYVNGNRMISEPEYTRLLSSLEFLEYSIAKVEEERNFKNNFVKNGAASFLKSMTPLPDGNKVIRANEDFLSTFTPSWVEDVLFSKGEKARRTKRELEKVRVGYELWPLSSFFNASGPSQKAAREMTKEFAQQKVEREMALEKLVEKHERNLKLRK
jgi:hypothetical protein